ncbi:MAG: acyltransferase [Promethearchaeota archaeon]
MDYKAEVFDQVQLLFDITGFNDHTLHCVLRFDSELDVGVLKKAVIYSIEAIPILGTRYIDGEKPHWTSIDEENFSEAFVIINTKKEFEEQVVYRIKETRGPQVKIGYLDLNPPALTISMNHMICDAAGFKEYLYFLCQIYSKLTDDSEYKPCMITGDRSIRRVLKNVRRGTKLKTFLSQKSDNTHNWSGNHQFPLSKDEETRPFILTRKIDLEKTGLIKSYSQTMGATLNDVVLAAYYRCLSRKLELGSNDELCIPVMVDMRRYLAQAENFKTLTNLTSTVITQLNCRSDENFKTTLIKVKALMEEKKSNNIGIKGFIALNLVYRLLKSEKANKILRSKLKNPPICMTNVGILDSTRMYFSDIRPCDAFLCGSIKYKPHFQLAMSTYKEELTLSVNLYGSSSDRDLILAFLKEIEEEIFTANF